MLKIVRRAAAVLTALMLVLTLAAPAFALEDERDLTPLPDSYFDDAVIIGDSVSYTLQSYCEETGDLGDAMFFSERSFTLRGAVGGASPVWYQGRTYFIQDLLEELGRSKVILMIGVNDIGQEGGVDVTMTMWETLCERIVEQNPDIRIFLQSSMPMYASTEHDGFTNDNINYYNDCMREFCYAKGYVFIDIADAFRNDEGSLEELYSGDHYVHLNGEAAPLWVEQLRDPANYSVDPRSLDHEESA